ncbi:MAG: AAA family ATPase, partial [Bowdeniella nasicola]|nr:AAA family ATPase [Bowdeniella nasicola]
MRTWRELNQGSDLPCRAVAPALARLYSDAATPLRAVVTAPPGSGKTTLIPAVLAELEEAAGGSGTIIVCQPRRVAARAAAHRLADLLEERVGERVGYAVRGDTQAGRNTRVLMVTSGVLVARLLADPELAGVSAVVIDEVHERSLVTDVALAFSLD